MTSPGTRRAAFVLLSTVVLLSPVIPDGNAQQACLVGSEATGDACVKPLTGCVCSGYASGPGSSHADCEGGRYSVTVNLNCTYASSPPTNHAYGPFTGTLPCNSKVALTVRGPCTGEALSPFAATCAPRQSTGETSGQNSPLPQ